MRLRSALLLPLSGLAACHGSVDWNDRDTGHQSVHIGMDQAGDGNRLAVNIPGFDAKIGLPGIDLARHLDLDGIRLAPDTHVGGVDINGQQHRDGDGAGEGHGEVLVRFTAPQPPAALLDYYRRSATEAGYTALASGPGAFTAAKHDKRFVLSVAADGGGSRGTIAIGDQAGAKG